MDEQELKADKFYKKKQVKYKIQISKHVKKNMKLL